MYLLRSLSCDQRTAALMLDFAERYRERGYSGSEFRLRMRRKDIASYIGAKHETVCRAMTRLRTQGLIDIRRDLVRIVDAGRLRAFVETV